MVKVISGSSQVKVVEGRTAVAFKFSYVDDTIQPYLSEVKGSAREKSTFFRLPLALVVNPLLGVDKVPVPAISQLLDSKLVIVPVGVLAELGVDIAPTVSWTVTTGAPPTIAGEVLEPISNLPECKPSCLVH